jgi:hypothetical protein
MDDTQVRALDVCLQRLQTGEDLQQVLEFYPQLSDQLGPLLEAAEVVQWYGKIIQVPEIAQAKSRSRFTQAELSPPVAAPTPAREPSGWIKIISLALALLVILVGTWSIIAARGALPGDFLYPMKIALERTRLQLTNDPLRRLGMEQAYDEERLGEVKSLLQTPRPESVQFAGGLSQMGGSNWQVSGIRVVVPADAQIIGNVEEGIYVIVEGTVQPDGSVLAHRLQPREFDLSGKLQNFLPDRLTVAGIPIEVSVETLVHGSPQVGNPVHVSAYLLLDGNFQARLVEAADQIEE